MGDYTPYNLDDQSEDHVYHKPGITIFNVFKDLVNYLPSHPMETASGWKLILKIILLDRG